MLAIPEIKRVFDNPRKDAFLVSFLMSVGYGGMEERSKFTVSFFPDGRGKFLYRESPLFREPIVRDRKEIEYAAKLVAEGGIENVEISISDVSKESVS